MAVPRGRRFGIPDIVVIAGLGVSFMLLVFLFIGACSEGLWAIMEAVFLTFAYLFAVAAFAISFQKKLWLLFVAIFAGLQIAQSCFHVSPLHSANGMDLLWLLAGITTLLGTELGRREMFQFAAPLAVLVERAPEDRLRQLQELHEKGMLSDAEYAEGRQQVLNGLAAGVL